jgi:hypothetical protein
MVSTSSAAVSASAGRTADGQLGERDLISIGVDSTITGLRLRAFRFLACSPFAVASRLSSSHSRERCAKISVGGNRPALAAVSQLRAAERGEDAHAPSVHQKTPRVRARGSDTRRAPLHVEMRQFVCQRAGGGR